MMKFLHFIFASALSITMVGCATVPPPKWSTTSDAAESEYSKYISGGTSSVSGQAFLAKRNGDVVKAAGRLVTLDPATSIGIEWWDKAGKLWIHRTLTPPSVAFNKARFTTTADADGKFRFQGLAAGKYYARTEVTWEVGSYEPTQGGLVGQIVEVTDNQSKEIILNDFPK
jgi:hypothetical protein